MTERLPHPSASSGPQAEDADASWIVEPGPAEDAATLDRLFPSDGARRPLLVDIGCGKGRFLLAWAARHADMNFLGIDRQIERLRKVEKRGRRAGLRNVRLVHAEAHDTVRRLLAPSSVSLFTISFPDPWPKRRHHKRRLFTPAFLDALFDALTPGGQVQIATDHTDYSREIRACFRGDARFAEVAPLESDDEDRTNFEIVFRRLGLNIHRAAYAKPA